ncbi:putative F-box protein At2g02030 [Bidens hawaiensis]|uniref:putative F-box protein At2g02030 n=1 Tax=Bidens hawaiensis TaxID=980011 RepID=UPI00404AAF6F
MSDYLPLEIQDKILKRLPVRSLVRFRSVLKTWKTWIDSSHFVYSYTRHQPHTKHRLLVRYDEERKESFNKTAYEERFISIADDDTFPLDTLPLNSPPRFYDNSGEFYEVIGCSDGLLCFYSITAPRDSFGGRAVIWNPSIRRALEIDVPNVADGKVYNTVLGFGVCCVTNDPKIAKINYVEYGHESENVTSVPFQVELYTLSTGAWRSLSGNLPRISVEFEPVTSTNYSVATDGFVYWLATDVMLADDMDCRMIVSFDITCEEFGEVNLPDWLARSNHFLHMSKLRESLVLLEHIEESAMDAFTVWMMEGGLFTPLYTFIVNTPCKQVFVMGFRQRGDAMIEITDYEHAELLVYEQLLEQIHNLGLDGSGHAFYVHSYMETLTLFLHNHPDLTFCTDAVRDNLV